MLKLEVSNICFPHLTKAGGKDSNIDCWLLKPSFNLSALD